MAASAVLGVLALAAAVRLRGPGRPVLGLLAVFLPVALSAPTTIDHGIDNARRNARMGDAEAASIAPPAAVRGRNFSLTVAAERRIPQGSVYGVVLARPPGGPLSPGEARDRFYGAAWTKFRLAPRIAVDGTDADWVLLFDTTPVREGIDPAQAWRFGDDWLVRR